MKEKIKFTQQFYVLKKRKLADQQTRRITLHFRPKKLLLQFKKDRVTSFSIKKKIQAYLERKNLSLTRYYIQNEINTIKNTHNWATVYF